MDRGQYGKNWFRAKLQRKGIPKETIEEALEGAYAESSEEALAARAFDEKMRSLRDEVTRKAIERSARFLKSRGFADSLIFRLVDNRGTIADEDYD